MDGFNQIIILIGDVRLPSLHNFLCSGNLSSFNLLSLLHNSNYNFHPRPPLIAQLNVNPNNKTFQPSYVTDMTGYPTYYIFSIECNEIHLKFVQVLNQGIPLIINKKEEEEIQPFKINDPIHNFVNNVVYNSKKKLSISLKMILKNDLKTICKSSFTNKSGHTNCKSTSSLSQKVRLNKSCDST